MLNFEQRVSIAVEQVRSFLATYSSPRHLDNTAKAEMIGRIAQSIARKLPVGTEEGYKENIKKAFASVSDAHESYSWPPPGVFAKCLQKSSPSATGHAPETFSVDPRRIEIERMKRGDDVRENFVWSAIAAHEVDGDTINLYRQHSVDSYFTVYGKDGVKNLADHYGSAVLAYTPKSLTRR